MGFMVVPFTSYLISVILGLSVNHLVTEPHPEVDEVFADSPVKLGIIFQQL
jgi:hypothetical protein